MALSCAETRGRCQFERASWKGPLLGPPLAVALSKWLASRWPAANLLGRLVFHSEWSLLGLLLAKQAGHERERSTPARRPEKEEPKARNVNIFLPHSLAAGIWAGNHLEKTLPNCKQTLTLFHLHSRVSLLHASRSAKEGPPRAKLFPASWALAWHSLGTSLVLARLFVWCQK